MSKVKQMSQNCDSALIPVACFLSSVFPHGIYKGDDVRIVKGRLFKPRKDCEEISLSFPLDWEAKDRVADRNWRMELQGWAVFRPIMSFFDTYDDKDAVVDFFFTLAEDWWAVYGEDPTNIVTSRMPGSYAWYDMSVGFRALIIGFFADRIAAFNLKISPKRAAFLDALGRKHIANLTTPETFSLNNHGIIQTQGLMALLRTLPEDENFALNEIIALRLMESLVSSQFDANGFHTEHSPHYHFYVLTTFEAVIKSGWFASSTKIISCIANARAARNWLVDPQRRPICVGDSFLTEQKSVVFPEATGTPYLLSDFDETGYAVLRSDWDVPADKASMVFLMGAYHSKTHKHRDCLSFDWFDQGQRIICDGGKYGYKSDKFRHHVLSYKAHNTAEIDGFDILKIKPYGSAIHPSNALSGGVYQLQAKLDFPAIKHARSIYVCPGRWIVVQDQLEYARARGTTLWFHLETDFRLCAAKGPSLQAKGKGNRQVFIDCLAPGAQLEIQYGNETEMKGFVSDNDYKILPSLTAGFSVSGAKHSICTLIALSPAARSEAFQFASDRLDGGLVVPSNLNTTAKRWLPNIPHHIFPEPKALKLQPGHNTYRVRSDGVDIAFFYDRKKGNRKKVLIMLPGASSRKYGHANFQRYSWSKDFPDHDVVAFTDPSLKPTNSLGLAWFQHTKGAYGIPAAATLIRQIIELGEYAEKDVVFFGSSGGGFSALQLANAFPKAKVIAINPQIYLYNYSPHHYNSMLEVCYPGLTKTEVRKQYLDRITVQLNLETREAPTYIFQNIRDVPHLERHLNVFVKRQNPSDVTETADTLPNTPNKLNVVLFDDLNSGHTPPTRDETVQMLKPLL